MAPPRPTITPNVGVPKASYRKITSTGKVYDGVDDKIAQQYGYNKAEVSFDRPEHYIRYVEPIESELSTQVEYDMDEQDDEWLNAINRERYKDQDERVSSETFEIIIDRLEKEWFDLMKRIPKPDQALPSEDSTCAVCDDGEGENSNAIVFCDGCNLAVHQDCYGVPYIPEGQWLCRKCTVAPESRVECILCPNEGGAFKQTSTGKWAHLLCAIWVPECILGNPTFMEPIENSDKIPKQRWKLVCSICKVKQGACIQCNKNTCVTAFHVSCARRQKLLSPMKSHGEGELQAFCEKHLPIEMRVNRVVPSSPLPPIAPTSPVRSPKKPARSQIQQTGPPLVPTMIVDNIMEYTAKIKFRKKLQFLLAVCRYWSLKRDARRGAPLLKRLHLEPWSTSAASKLQTNEDKTKYIENLHRLREDLLHIRTLADLICQREAQKYLQVQAAESLITSYFLPFDGELRETYDSIVAMDRSNYFMNPVSRIEVPDYYDTISKPMHWTGIYAKIEQHEYLDSQAFADDINLVLDNAIKYNKKDSAHYRVASRIKNNAKSVLDNFQNSIGKKAALWKENESRSDEEMGHDGMINDQNVENIAQESFVSPNLGEEGISIVVPNGPANIPPEEEVIPETPDLDQAERPDLLVEKLQSPDNQLLKTALVGDMEPFPLLLRILQDKSSVSEDLDYILATNPLTSFFTFERPILKPPPPPPPPPPSKQPRKPKRKPGTFNPTSGSPSRGEPSSTRITRGTAGRAEPGSPQHSHHQRVVLLVRDPTQAQIGDRDGEHLTGVEPGSLLVSQPTAQSGSKRKRQDSESWGHQIVDDVGARESFKRFESGWVLPPGSTRTRRPTLAASQTSFRKSSKEPIKRVRTSSSAAGSRQSSQMPPVEPPVPSESTNPEVSLPVETMEIYPPASESAPVTGLRTLKLKVLDEKPEAVSSAARRNGDSSSDLSELSEADEAKADRATAGETKSDETKSDETKPGETKPDETKLDEMESDEMKASKTKANEANPDASVTPAPLQEPTGIHHDNEGEPTHYEEGTLVWAKQAGFPWYPAAVFELPDERVPPKVAGLEEETRRKLRCSGPMYLVQFYDKNRTWTWVPLSKLTMLGEVPAIDQKYLHPSGKRGDKKALQQAYDLAMQDMETLEEAIQVNTGSEG